MKRSELKQIIRQVIEESIGADDARGSLIEKAGRAYNSNAGNFQIIAEVITGDAEGWSDDELLVQIEDVINNADDDTIEAWSADLEGL
jgi:hypothetical protein